MKQTEQPVATPRAYGVQQYLLWLYPDQVKLVDEMQHRLGVRTRSAMVRALIEKGLEAKDWSL